MAAIRITLTMEADLLRQVDEAVRAGAAGSRSALIQVALQRELRERRRAAIDAAFAAAADDEEYLAESEAIEQEFAVSSWEALLEAERDYESP